METLKLLQKIGELRNLNKNLSHRLSEKVIENLELKSELKDSKEEISRLMETASVWANEVVKNYNANGGDLEKAQIMTGMEIRTYELSKGKENSNVSNI